MIYDNTRALVFVIMVLIAPNANAQNTSPKFNESFEKVGYIPHDPDRDDAKFNVCNEQLIQEYYQVNPKFKEGLYSIRKDLEGAEMFLNALCQSDGIVVIRFVINCYGEIGRIRSAYFDLNYDQIASVNDDLEKGLVEYIKNMGSWTPGSYQGKSYDSYQQLKFRVSGNKISNIFF
jgi:hypothetical protein